MYPTNLEQAVEVSAFTFAYPSDEVARADSIILKSTLEDLSLYITKQKYMWIILHKYFVNYGP